MISWRENHYATFVGEKSYHMMILKSSQNNYLSLTKHTSLNQRMIGGVEIFFIKSKKVYNHIENSKYSLDDIKDLLQKNKNASKFFIMEELCKPVYDIDILTWEGELFRCIQRKRIHSDFPNEGHEIVTNKLILKFVKELLRNLIYQDSMTVILCLIKKINQYFLK